MFTERAGVLLHYEVRGQGEPLLLIMGLGADMHFWEFQIPAFAERHRVIALDNRGMGQSGKPKGPYTVQEMADDAVAVLDAAGIQRAHVLGLSMGGMIAQDFAIRHGDRLGALVLAATYARPDRGIERTSEEAAKQTGLPTPMSLLKGGAGIDLAQIDVKQVFRFMMSMVLSPEFISREREWLRGVMSRALESGASIDNFLAQVSAVMHHDSAEALARVRAPTLVLTGTNDVLVPPHHSDELARLIPGARLERIEGGTHGFNIEMKERFNKAVLDFLAEHPL